MSGTILTSVSAPHIPVAGETPTASLPVDMPYCVYPGGLVSQWIGSAAYEWLEDHVGESREDWFDSADEFTDRVDFTPAAVAALGDVDFCVWFRRQEDAALFRLMFDARH